MSELPTTTWGTESDANRIKKTYVKGFMDVSGGELSVHNTAFNIFNSDGSGVLRINPRKITVKDDIGQEVDISLSYLTFLNNLVPADGQAVSIPEKVKYIFTSGTETRVGKSDASSNFRVYGNTYIEQFLFVSNDVSLNGNLYVKSNTRMDGDLSLNNRLFVSKDVSLNGNLYVKSKTRLDNDLSLNGILFVSKDVSLNSNLYVKSNTWMDGDLSLNNRLFVSKDVSLNSNLYVKSKSYFGSDVSLNGKFTMYGDASLNGRLMLSGDASLNSNLYVLSKTRLGNDLSLNGNLFLYGGDASINGLLLVSKDASLNGNLYVSGRTTFYEPSGSVITSGTLRGTLNLTHGDASGGSSILFQSVNSADDYAYIQYQENVPYAGQTSLESGLLTIGIENEITGVNRDRIALMSANGSGNVGINTKFPNYNLDVSGQMRICEGTGTIASATTGSIILEHTAVGGTSSIMFKGPNSTTNDYAYIQYEDNTAYTLPVLKYDFSANSGTTFTSTGSNTAILTKSGVPANITSVAVSGLSPPNKFPAGISCIRFNQTNLTVGSGDTIAYLQTSASSFTAGGFTFSAWIRPSIVSAANCRFYILNISPGSLTSKFDIYIDGDTGRIAAICGEDSTNYKHTNILTQNVWRHYAFTFDNATSTGNHYLDGDLVTSGDMGTTYSGKQLTAINQSILMGLKYEYNTGGQIGTTGKYAKGFHGYMNYVNMFDRALSISEIAVLYNTPEYTQSTVNRGLMTFGIENEPGAVFNDRIALMPANGSGFVGINTKTPSCALDVIGSINATGPLSVSANTSVYDLSNSFSGSTALKGGILVNNTGSGSRLILGAYHTSDINSLSAIQSSDYYVGVENAQELLLNPLGGAVGIGTKNPTYNLDVSGNCEITCGTADTNPSLTIIKDTGTAAIFCTGGADDWQHRAQLQIQDVRGNSMVLAMSTDGVGIIQGKQFGDGNYKHISINPHSVGNVGIGTRAPAFKLDVSGTVNATSYNATSDYRVKTDVKPLDASFNIDVLKPVTYTNTRHGRQDVGFIAHEVQEHYPFLVNGEKDGEQMQSLNYIGLIGILTKEIQDLKRRLAETEAKVASVETNVRTIETKVEEVDDIIISVEDNVLSVKNAVRTVDDKVSSVENTVQKVENTVLLEQARLTICETEIALNKSVIKDLDERFQS